VVQEPRAREPKRIRRSSRQCWRFHNSRKAANNAAVDLAERPAVIGLSQRNSQHDGLVSAQRAILRSRLDRRVAPECNERSG